MLVDAERTFLSQRSLPEMATFSVAVADDGVTIARNDLGAIHVPIEPRGSESDVTVWRSVVQARQVSSEIDRWFSNALKQPCSLVAMTDDSKRPVNPDYGALGDQVSFADGYPLLLANVASLSDLNARLEASVPMNRFRPSVVVEGWPAWDEDTWTGVQIGDVFYRVAKPCGRCLVTTTDQETGERGIEPLRTLATFRQVDRSVNFGMYLIPDNVGEVSVGDEVSVV
jgi:uncharacterized protein YcbX